jgi:uncharacterized damage-inducible protein DinB
MNQQALRKTQSQLNGSLEELFTQIQPDHLQWRPRENMRTLMELANHLAQLPSIDLKIITHAYHDRAQLFTYLKVLGRPVDMFTLYA